MTEWKEYKLGEIADVQTGPFGSQLHMSDYQKEGTPIITVEHLGDNRIIHNNLPLVGEEDKNRLKKYVLAEGDIVFSRVGSVDRRAYVSAKEDGWMFSGRCLRVRPSQKADAKFLSYYFGLEDFKETIRRIAVGATMPSINTTILSNVVISLPPLDTQRRISSILSSLDDKIDLLHRENATLEQMAETLFRQWFVVEAKEEWEEGKLGDYVELVNGVSYKGNELQPSNVAMATLKSFSRNGGFRMDGYKEYVGKYKNDQVLSNGDLIVAHTDITQEADVIGNPALVCIDSKYDAITFSMDVVKVVSKTQLFSSGFLYYLMKTPNFKEHCLGYANGSTVLHLSKKAIPEFEFLLPPLEKIQAYNNIVSQTLNKVGENNKQIQTLIQMRDGLLPRLMNREVKI